MTKLIRSFLLPFILLAILFQSLYAEEGVFAETSSRSKSLFVSLESSPQKVYIGQVFSVKVKAIVAKSKVDALSNTFSEGSNVVVLNPQATWESAGSNTYYATFLFKVTSKNASMPRLSVSLIQNQEALESEIIGLSLPSVVQLKNDPLFCNVIAQSFNVNKYKTTTFDAKNVIVVLEIETSGANLQDFKLGGIAKSGIDSYSQTANGEKIYYYAIIPNYQREFEFTYFDLPSNKFQKITLPVIIESDEVSTQLGLNPKESIFEFYKTIAYGVFAFVFFVILLKKRRWYYLLPVLIFTALFFLDKNPLNKVKLKANSALMILPTERSTVFFTNDKMLDVERLGDRDNYIKILLPDGKIGWTQRENITQN
ncbi:hypothetical protein [Sulfurospirillum cavolei]|uniref:hypothetical protein n=1 Tax=Sulfurospirillum cavolei TaxID=366522 RepID=UPI000764B654|nr:hypothetical protein [Sulfurospirillum cavolei]